MFYSKYLIVIKFKYGKLSNIGHSNPNWTETEKEANDKKNDTKAVSHDENEEHVCSNIIKYFS